MFILAKTYTMEIAGVKRELPLCPVSDKLDIAAFILFGDVEVTVKAAEELLKKCPEFDYILTPEAKSIPLAYEMSRQSGKKYFVARKKPKVYMTDPVCVSVRSITTDAEQTLLLGREDGDQLRGKKVLIVDDVISTGESLAAVVALADKFEANIVAKAAVLAEGDAAERDDIVFLEFSDYLKKRGSFSRNTISSRSAASPSARTAALATDVRFELIGEGNDCREGFAGADNIVNDKHFLAAKLISVLSAEKKGLLCIGGYRTHADTDGVGHIDLRLLAGDKIFLTALSGHLIGKRNALRLGSENIIELRALLEQLFRRFNGDFDITEKDECRDIELVADRAERKLSLHACDFHCIGLCQNKHLLNINMVFFISLPASRNLCRRAYGSAGV